MSTKTYGQTGYEAYAAQTGGKTWDNRAMPQWHELPPNIVLAWETAAVSIIAAYDPPKKPQPTNKLEAIEVAADGVEKQGIEAKADGTTSELVVDGDHEEEPAPQPTTQRNT